MCSLTWDECNIESHWRGSVVLKRRFLSGFKNLFFFLFQNCENFTLVPLFSPAQLHFYFGLFCQNMPAVQLLFISSLFKRKYTQSSSRNGDWAGKRLHSFFCDMKHKMLNIAPLICVYYHSESTRCPVHLHRKE